MKNYNHQFQPQQNEKWWQKLLNILLVIIPLIIKKDAKRTDKPTKLSLSNLAKFDSNASIIYKLPTVTIWTVLIALSTWLASNYHIFQELWNIVAPLFGK